MKSEVKHIECSGKKGKMVFFHRNVGAADDSICICMHLGVGNPYIYSIIGFHGACHIHGEPVNCKSGKCQYADAKGYHYFPGWGEYDCNP